MSASVSPEARVGKRAEQKRRWDRENKLKCECGGSMARDSAICLDCARVAQREQFQPQRERIETLWAAGATNAEIGASLGIRHFTAGAYRAHGYNLPHRITLGPGRWRWAD